MTPEDRVLDPTERMEVEIMLRLMDNETFRDFIRVNHTNLLCFHDRNREMIACWIAQEDDYRAEIRSGEGLGAYLRSICFRERLPEPTAAILAELHNRKIPWYRRQHIALAQKYQGTARENIHMRCAQAIKPKSAEDYRIVE